MDSLRNEKILYHARSTELKSNLKITPFIIWKKGFFFNFFYFERKVGNFQLFFRFCEWKVQAKKWRDKQQKFSPFDLNTTKNRQVGNKQNNSVLKPIIVFVWSGNGANWTKAFIKGPLGAIIQNCGRSSFMIHQLPIKKRRDKQLKFSPFDLNTTKNWQVGNKQNNSVLKTYYCVCLIKKWRQLDKGLY